MAITERRGNIIVVDLSKIPYEFGSPEFINLHLKDLCSMNLRGVRKIRYEEEETFELDEKNTAVLIEYAMFIRSVEAIMMKKEIYGLEIDENYHQRKEVLRRFYEYLFMNPLLAEEILAGYNEPLPSKAVFLKGQQTFKAWINGILKRFRETKMYQLVKKMGDLRSVFLSMLGLKALYFVDTLMLDLPKNARPLAAQNARYELPYGVVVQIYEVPGMDTYLYTIKNKYLEQIDDYWKHFVRQLIDDQLKEDFTGKDFRILFELKTKEYYQRLLMHAVMNNKQLTHEQALALAREAAAWVVGLGAPLENIALDQENIVDIYIDGENTPIYLEHKEFGICHTLFRYNHELLERAFKHIVLGSGKGAKFDENVPVVDVVVKRLSMRCHLQRPPATFGELQGALRVMKEEPFTYPMYFFYKSMSAFFAGYDDVMVNLGNSEAVLGIKGTGKTSLTSAKICAIGPKMRIIAIQDIEEMPIRAYRKRGFHITTVRVRSTDVEAGKTKTLDLVTMANALLRMGDAALIINEVRSRETVQGIINLLNTQPGVFLLYNLHAESLQEIQDRLELVFGIPAVCMLATDRYTFLAKTKFGRKSKFYRLICDTYETDHKEKQFKHTFTLNRGKSIDTSKIECLFLKNRQASEWLIGEINFRRLEKELNIQFIPPALERRAKNMSVTPEQYIIQAFFKGKVFEDIFLLYKRTGNKQLLELDFVLMCNAYANQLIVQLEDENGQVDFQRAYDEWKKAMPSILKSATAKAIRG